MGHNTFLQSLKKFFLNISLVVYSWSSIFAKNVATSSALGLSFITLPKGRKWFKSVRNIIHILCVLNTGDIFTDGLPLQSVQRSADT